MNAASNAPDEGLTTEQIAAAGRGDIPSPPGPEGRQPGTPSAQPVPRTAGDARPDGAGLAGEDNGLGVGPAGGRGEYEPGPAGGRGEYEPGPADAAAVSARDGNGLARLVEGDELQRIVTRWKEIQAQFVDEPRTAVQQADALVAGLMQQLAAMFARERAELEQRWAGGDGVSTEELRQSLRRYRSFFERLLAA